MGCTGSKDGHSLKLTKPPAQEGVTHCGPWLKHIDDLKGYPVFPAEYQSSALCKALTKDVWEKYHGKRDAAGVPFEQCILSGCQNVDSGIGCYAGSHSSYTDFADLFDHVIEGYHKHGNNDKHVSNMDASQLNCPDFPEDEAAMIISTRIRVGRNLADYPLGPGITNEQRIEIMTRVTEAFNNYEGDLAGKFYALNALSKKERKTLINDHFLFK